MKITNCFFLIQNAFSENFLSEDLNSLGFLLIATCFENITFFHIQTFYKTYQAFDQM